MQIDHVYSIDEFAYKLTAKYQEEQKAIQLAKDMRIGIQRNVGDYLTCSIGTASNEFLAKVGTNMQKLSNCYS